MITLWFARHGLTVWNIEKRYQGHSDAPLNPAGLAQAEALADRLASEKLHAIFSSDLQRAVQTASSIAVRHPLSVSTEPRLREANFGLFEGLRYKEIVDQYPMMAKNWFADPEQPPQGGEKLSEVAARVGSCVDDLIAGHAGKRLLLVGHDGALRLMMCHLLGMPAPAYWRFNLDPGSLTRVNVYPGGAILIRLNDIGHLEREDKD
jgi:broad specificity phosphatase PhoE